MGLKRLLLLLVLWGCMPTSDAPPEATAFGQPSAPMEVAPPPVEPPAVLPAPKDVEYKTIVLYTTLFKTAAQDGRVKNITLIAEKLANFTLQPGEEFSFNQRVGPRTVEAGFRNAPTIFLGEVLEGVGGGTCQVSSTLYAAVLHAGLDVTARRPHSRPSSYIDEGLDATVNYPASCQTKDDPNICYDLRFKNPYSFPLLIQTKVGPEADSRRTLTVMVYATGSIPKVTTTWKAWGSLAFETRERRIPYWKEGRRHLKQPGRPGLEGARIVQLVYPDGRTVTRKVFSKYQPVPEIWEVGSKAE